MASSIKKIVRMTGLLVMVSAGLAFGYTGQELAGKATLSLERARAIALKASSGTIVAEELEQEKGGSGLRYSFDIRHGKITREIGVDAKTGAVLENAPEGPNPD